MHSSVLTHARFQRPPVQQKRRRGRLPGVVVNINRIPRLQVGVLAQLFDPAHRGDHGKRIRITGYDPTNGGNHYEGTSLDGPIQCEGGPCEMFVWFRPDELRRAWRGLTENERVRLRLLRGAV